MRTIGLAALAFVAFAAPAFAGEHQQAGQQDAQQACPTAKKPNTQTAVAGNEVAQDPNKRGVLNVGETGNSELRDPNKRGILNTAQANCAPPADPPKR